MGTCEQKADQNPRRTYMTRSATFRCLSILCTARLSSIITKILPHDPLQLTLERSPVGPSELGNLHIALLLLAMQQPAESLIRLHCFITAHPKATVGNSQKGSTPSPADQVKIVSRTRRE
jgi:hypothetical protein